MFFVQDDEISLVQVASVPSYRNMLPSSLHGALSTTMLNSCVVQSYNEEDELRRKYPEYFKKHRRAHIHVLTGEGKMDNREVEKLNYIGCKLRDVLPPHFFRCALIWYAKIVLR